MNILFFTENEVHPNMGGIERVTFILSETFKRLLNHDLYACYLHPIPGAPNLYVKKMRWDLSSDTIKQFLLSNQIDIIISQRQLNHEKLLQACIQEVNKNIILISVLHCMPGYEITDREYIRYSISYNQGWASWKYRLKDLFYPIYRNWLQYKARKAMQLAYTNSNAFVVLSSTVLDLYVKTYQILPDKKLMAINNPLTYTYFYPIDKLATKEKIVLIVSRLEERSKRISNALKVWKEIEKKHDDWKLLIIGEGPDTNSYKMLVKTWKLKQVEFLGKCEPFDYYKRSSLFLMTSANEGWSMTLTEAMQTGNVPIAFDSFPALHDIIDSGQNGYIVKNGDLKTFISRLCNLICDTEKRHRMAEEAIHKVSKFSREKIANNWKDLFNQLEVKNGYKN